MHPRCCLLFAKCYFNAYLIHLQIDRFILVFPSTSSFLFFSLLLSSLLLVLSIFCQLKCINYEEWNVFFL
ncbi:hypothetical protein KSF78_0009750 [Schistosoma japonicum]|nr:hypothetical protein KSF78_0009750 [Schistosoma japonicum]